MENLIVNLYVETTAHGPRQKGGRGACVIEYIYPDGTVETQKAMTGWMDRDETGITLRAVIHALQILAPGQNVKIFTSCARIQAAVGDEEKEGWLANWKKNDWKTSKGEPPANELLWKWFDFLIQSRKITVTTEPNSYRNWLQAELKRQKDSNQK